MGMANNRSRLGIRRGFGLGSAILVSILVASSVVAQEPDVSPAQVTLATAVAARPGPHHSPQPSTSSPAPTSAPTPPVGNPSLPAPGSTVTPGSLPGLFPTVTPTPSAGSGKRVVGHHRVHITLTSATLPLNLRLIGGQLAGLAVLAAAITMVVARLSLRPRLTGRSTAPGQSGRSAADGKKS